MTPPDARQVAEQLHRLGDDGFPDSGCDFPSEWKLQAEAIITAALSEARRQVCEEAANHVHAHYFASSAAEELIAELRQRARPSEQTEAPRP